MSALPAMQQQKKAKIMATLGDRLGEGGTSPSLIPPDPASALPPLDESQFSVDGTAPAPTPAPAPAPPALTVVPSTPSPAPAGTTRSASELAAELNEQRWQTLQGMYNAQKAELDQLREANRQLQEDRAPAPSGPHASPAPSGNTDIMSLLPNDDDPSFKLTETEVAEYADSFPVIGKLAKKQANELVKSVLSPMVATIARLEKQLGEQTQKIDRSTEGTFMSAVRAHVQDFDTVTAHEGWRPFLASRVPFSTMTFGKALMTAHEGQQLEHVKEIFGKFRELHNQKPSEIPGTFAAPPASGASPTPQSTTKPTLKWSQRQKASEDFTKGRINHAQLQQIDALYKQAEMDGRVDFKA